MSLCTPFVSDTLGRVLVVTSTNRPEGADLYAGRWIYETDTLRTLMYDGTGWIIMDEPDQTYSPVFTGTNSAGTETGYYRRSGGWCDFSARYVCAGADVTGASVSVSTPVTISSSGFERHQFNVSFYDASGTIWVVGTTNIDSNSSPTLLVVSTSGTYAGLANVAAGVPFTWAASDAIHVTGRFSMSTRYL